MPSAARVTPPLVPMPPPVLKVEGLFELALAFRKLDKDFGNGLKEALENAAQPVADTAQDFALSRISGIRRGRIAWNQMRIGSNLGKGLVYVAPQQRGLKRFDQRKSRPKFATRLLQDAMIPALNENAGRIEHEFENTLDDATRAWERI